MSSYRRLTCLLPDPHALPRMSRFPCDYLAYRRIDESQQLPMIGNECQAFGNHYPRLWRTRLCPQPPPPHVPRLSRSQLMANQYRASPALSSALSCLASVACCDAWRTRATNQPRGSRHPVRSPGRNLRYSWRRQSVRCPPRKIRPHRTRPNDWRTR